ncbi:MAG TPA: hypothetical protein VGK77_29590 [Candidatus Binatia bacterium]|jgi:hypothetical protein
MRLFEKALPAVSLSLVLSLGASWQATAQESASASVKPAAPSKIERPPSMNQGVTGKKQHDQIAASNPGDPKPPCNSKINPKCKGATKSQYRD